MFSMTLYDIGHFLKKYSINEYSTIDVFRILNPIPLLSHFLYRFITATYRCRSVMLGSIKYQQNTAIILKQDNKLREWFEKR